MTVEHLESEVRHYRRQHRKNIHERNEWLRILDGRRTGMVRHFERMAEKCRAFAREKIEALRELRQ